MTTDEIMLAELQAKAHEVYQSAYTVGQAAHILHNHKKEGDKRP